MWTLIIETDSYLIYLALFQNLTKTKIEYNPSVFEWNTICILFYRAIINIGVSGK